jgi:hypothetical protein
MSLSDEIARILKVPDIPRVALGLAFSSVFRPFSNFVRATDAENDYTYFSQSQYPAYFNPLSASVTFVENALEYSEEVARKLALNPMSFRQLYGLGSWVNERRHWKDLVSEGSCVPSFYKAQSDFWQFSSYVAEEGSTSLKLGGYRQANGQMFKEFAGPRGAFLAILGSSLWTETSALDEERRLFGASSTKEGKTLHRACGIQPSQKPCLQMNQCAIHDLASLIAQTLRDRYGSLDILEQEIAERGYHLQNEMMPLPDMVLTVLLTLDEDQTDKDSIDLHLKSRIEQISNSVVQVQDRSEFILEYLSRSISTPHSSDEPVVLPELLVGRISDALRNMMSLEQLDGNRVFGRIFVEKNRWDSLRPEEKKLCRDLFRLRQEVYNAISQATDAEWTCMKSKRCPVMEAIEKREFHTRQGTINVRPSINEQLDYLREKYSHIPHMLRNWRKENREHLKRKEKSLMDVQEQLGQELG